MKRPASDDALLGRGGGRLSPAVKKQPLAKGQPCGSKTTVTHATEDSQGLATLPTLPEAKSDDNATATKKKPAGTKAKAQARGNAQSKATDSVAKRPAAAAGPKSVLGPSADAASIPLPSWMPGRAPSTDPSSADQFPTIEKFVLPRQAHIKSLGGNTAPKHRKLRIAWEATVDVWAHHFGATPKKDLQKRLVTHPVETISFPSMGGRKEGQKMMWQFVFMMMLPWLTEDMVGSDPEGLRDKAIAFAKRWCLEMLPTLEQANIIMHNQNNLVPIQIFTQ